MQGAQSKVHRFYVNTFMTAIALISLYALFQFARFYYFFTFTSNSVMQEMGIAFADAYPKINGKPADYVALDHLQTAGAMYQAGFRDGDILLDYPTGFAARGSFVRKLDQNRGNEIAIRVVDSEDGPPLDQRPVRTIQFLVP